jgi:UDP-N-acetylmuramate dehydrogenase
MPERIDRLSDDFFKRMYDMDLQEIAFNVATHFLNGDVPAKDLALGYRSSVFKGGNDVIIAAVFEFEEGNAEELLTTRERILSVRREKQPVDYPSCGSVFKRPAGNYAGTLIQSSGLKGFKVGGAMVSEKHANFIINTGDAKAEDVRGVIWHVQKTVYENSGILLEPEVIFVGEFDKQLFMG